MEWAGLGRAQAGSTSIYKCEDLIIIIMKITCIHVCTYTCTCNMYDMHVHVDVAIYRDLVQDYQLPVLPRNQMCTLEILE